VRKWILFLSAISIFAAFCTMAGCNLGKPDYTLTVEVGPGIAGYPETGSYEYKEFTRVEYFYEAMEGRTPPEVLLNSTRLETEGSFTVFADVKLTIRQIDIRKKWQISLLIGTTQAELDRYEITFSGDDNLSGTFVDERGRGGTWQSDGDQLTFAYTDWADYQFSGSISSMTGFWSGESRDGQWSATEIIEN
jgi:hypothetical protein